jgi:DUF4097 and DUF4098 domain-containing protein YvlB
MMKAVYAVIIAAGLTAGLCQAIEEAQRQEFHQSYALAADGRVSLKNVNGGVHITVWDRNEVKVDAVKSAKDQETLNATTIVVNAKANSVEIRTESKDHQHLAKVEYTLTVPRRAALDALALVNGDISVEGAAGRVRAKTVNGTIKSTGISGDVDLSTVNGTVNSELDGLQSTAHVSIKSVNGAVDAALPAGASAKVNARTVHGKVESDFGVPDTSRKVGQRLEAVLGSGAAPVEISTVNGAIRIRKR